MRDIVIDYLKYRGRCSAMTFNERRTWLRGAFDYLVSEEKLGSYGSVHGIENQVIDWYERNIDGIREAGLKGKLRPTLSSVKQNMSNQALEGFLLAMISTDMDYAEKARGNVKVVMGRLLVQLEWNGRPSRGLTKEGVALLTELENKEVWEADRYIRVMAGYSCFDGTGLEAIESGKEMMTTTTTEETKMTGMHIELSEGHKNAVNALLALDCGISVEDINNRFTEMANELEEAKVMATSASAISLPKHVEAIGEVPSGEVAIKPALEVFKEVLNDGLQHLFKFNVPVFDWAGQHPDVPMIDPNYKFDGQVLYRVLQGIVDGNNSYLYGHTGTGKSTMVEQVCAYLKYPLVRVNFDSEISRMDLIGRDTLVSVDGVTESKFVDGVVPDALSRPCVLLCDEVDFIRPDVMYVFQRVLEGNGLLITEDGGRKVVPDPMFRLIATANTVGQGDDTSMYQGARPQSMATLDRFENWAEMKYMQPEVEEKWLRGAAAGLTKTDAKVLIKYATEHREAFTSGRIMQPLSPRGLRAMAKRFVTTKQITDDKTGSMREAMDATILARCTTQDRTVLNGLVDRVIS